MWEKIFERTSTGRSWMTAILELTKRRVRRARNWWGRLGDGEDWEIRASEGHYCSRPRFLTAQV